MMEDEFFFILILAKIEWFNRLSSFINNKQFIGVLVFNISLKTI